MASRYCNLCGLRLTGKHYTYTTGPQQSQVTLVVCSSCEADAPRCCLCALPMVQQLALDGICSACLTTVDYCDVCGQPVREGMEMQDGTGRIFCQKCVRVLPACLACGAPVDGRGHILVDGRVRCWTCNASAVDDPATALELYAVVQKTVAQRLGMALSVPTQLIPADPAQLQAVLQMVDDGHSSELHRPRGVYARKGSRRGIYLELGLPRVQTIEVIAHELGHAWQVERSPLLADPILVEGFAEWVAYQVLSALGEVAATQIMSNRTDIYGQGLRQILDWQFDDPLAVLERSETWAVH